MYCYWSSDIHKYLESYLVSRTQKVIAMERNSYQQQSLCVCLHVNEHARVRVCAVYACVRKPALLP